MAITGCISLKHGGLFYTVYFSQNGWVVVDLAQYLGDVLVAKSREVGILKLLGYTMEIGKEWPVRKDSHWIEIDLDNRILTTNSDLIRKAVDQVAWSPKDPCPENVLKRLYRTLDEHDFTVALHP